MFDIFWVFIIFSGIAAVLGALFLIFPRMIGSRLYYELPEPRRKLYSLVDCIELLLLAGFFLLQAFVPALREPYVYTIFSAVLLGLTLLTNKFIIGRFLPYW